MCRSQTTSEEMKNTSDVFEELLDHLEMLKEKEDQSRGKVLFFNSYFHQCPRCNRETRMTGKDPYCPDCNWDSLSDPSAGAERWAA